MKVLGVDPGIATTGVGVIEKQGSRNVFHYCGAIITKPTHSLSERLLILSQQMNDLIAEHKPDVVAVEELFFNNNVTTAFAVGQARGVILLTCAQAGCQVFSYTPLQVKMGICGYGRAEKKQVQFMVKKLLNLESTPKPDDAADALALAICHSHHHRIKSLT